MELKDAIFNRRTVRKFLDKPVPDDVIIEILSAGIWAPSHGNNQPWEFVLIGKRTRKGLAVAYSEYMLQGPLKNPEMPEERKQTMREFMTNFGDAPVLLAVTSIPAKTELEKYDFPMSSAAAIQNIFLAAWEKEIAGVWLSYGMDTTAEKILQISEHSKIAGILALGYPDIIPPAQTRIPATQKLRRLE